LDLILVLDEYVVFITPTPLQLEIFRRILNPDKMEDLIEQSTTAESLALIGVLTKISNSPILLRATAESARDKEKSMFHKRNFTEAANLVPQNAQIDDMSLSGMTSPFRIPYSEPRYLTGKLIVLSQMLDVIREVRKNCCPHLCSN
jgi:DNA repair and recombination protein RAD54B